MEEFKRDIQLIRESQIRMEADLKYHIRRTDLLEEQTKEQGDKIQALVTPMPMKEKLQIGAFIAAIVSTIAAILRQFGV